MFLIRTAFWLTIVILILPADKRPSDNANAEQAGLGVNAGNIYSAARDTISDMSSICDRNPGVCETGQAAFKVFGDKARYGANMVMEFVSEQNSAANTSPAPATAPASLSFDNQAPQRGANNSQNTLSPTDLEPTWGGPLTADKV